MGGFAFSIDFVIVFDDFEYLSSRHFFFPSHLQIPDPTPHYISQTSSRIANPLSPAERLRPLLSFRNSCLSLGHWAFFQGWVCGWIHPIYQYKRPSSQHLSFFQQRLFHLLAYSTLCSTPDSAPSAARNARGHKRSERRNW